MLLWDQSENTDKQLSKLSKAYNEVKTQMRMEKKLSRVYEFLMNKEGSLKDNELEVLEVMKSSLMPGKEHELESK